MTDRRNQSEDVGYGESFIGFTAVAVRFVPVSGIICWLAVSCWFMPGGFGWVFWMFGMRLDGRKRITGSKCVPHSGSRFGFCGFTI